MNIRISTKGKRPMRSLTPGDKVHAIQRIHDGESKASVARDIGVPESTLRGWCKNEDKLRFMSRQATAEKISDPLALKFDGSSGVVGLPPEKRQRVDSSMVLNFSNKLKFDEFNALKRTPINSLDFGSNKALTEINNFSTLNPDFGVYNATSKSKLYVADITRQSDPPITAVSPISSLTNLSGFTSIGHSPLAISFSELTSNLNLLAQLNPGLAAMSGLNGLTSTAHRNTKQKLQLQGQSPHNDPSERQTGLTVKNWAKQKPLTPNSCESSSIGINLCQNDTKLPTKSPSSHVVSQTQIGTPLPSLGSMPDDPILYWLKSQQALLGFNSLYSQTPTIGNQSPPIRPTTPQQGLLATTPPIIPNPLTPSSTPSGSLDDKNSAWFNWCKAFGASLSSITPAAAIAALQATAATNSVQLLGNTAESSSPLHSDIAAQCGLENILYSHLTKDSTSSQSPHSSPSGSQCKLTVSENPANRPQDLSAKTSKTTSPPPDYNLETPISPLREVGISSPMQNSPSTCTEPHSSVTRSSLAECRDVLDNILYKINSNINVVNAPETFKYNRNNVDDFSRTNNNNNKITKNTNCEISVYKEKIDNDYAEAINHGEKFLQWLENCTDARVTAVQMMQLRYLISSIKKEAENKLKAADTTADTVEIKSIEIEDSCEESERHKMQCLK